MTASRTRTRSTKRTGITKFLGNIIDDTKEFVDDVLDRTRDAERDLRDTARRALRYDDDDSDGDQEQDIEALKEELDQLAEKIAALSAAQQAPSRPREQG